MSGARPCKSPKCDGIIIVLPNRYPDAKSNWIAVDVSSLSDDDKAQIQTYGKGSLDYDRGRHVGHHRTCKDLARFAKPDKRQPEKPQPKQKPEQATLFKTPPKPREWD